MNIQQIIDENRVEIGTVAGILIAAGIVELVGKSYNSGLSLIAIGLTISIISLIAILRHSRIIKNPKEESSTE